MAQVETRRSKGAVWLSLVVLAILALAFGLATLRAEPPDIAASGPVVAVPDSPAPAPLPDVRPQGAS